MRIRWRNLELPNRIHFEEDAQDPNHGVFVAEPFERGFGHTVGNSLRRVLLSSIEGAAVTAVRIEGVVNEFTTLPGVYEDVTDVVLNFKSVLLAMTTDDPRILTLSVKRKGEVTAADIECPADVTLINPQQHIATLTSQVAFNVELECRKGRGYHMAEENELPEQEIGRIPIDSLYSPVQRVRYRTEATRVGKLTNYDRLILEVWTNGAVTPELAVVEAAKILRKHLNPFVTYFELGEQIHQEEKGRPEGEGEIGRIDEIIARLQKPLAELELSVRAAHCLETEKCHNVGDLVRRAESSLLKIRNFGKTTLKEVKKKIADLGLYFGMDVDGILSGAVTELPPPPPDEVIPEGQ
ncbi:MAG: DNA-directed RNA polymerase subunit alpha [Planctomycetes bacterium]|nr:DNA-directed RNA polymerase subunit alpha [Planctomycetota bacterium]